MEMKKFEKFIVNSCFCDFLYKTIISPAFFKFINKELKGTLLEIGCGKGFTTNLISLRYKKLKITAIDYDNKQIAIAKSDKNNNKNIKILQGDATNLKFKNDSFDYCIEADVFHHIKDYGKAMKEAYRVLKNGGTFYLMDISKYFFIWPVGLFFPPESLFTKKEFINQLALTGFKVEKSKGNLLFFIAAGKK